MKILFCIMAIMLINGCAPVNSEFSCNKTAGDSCLTIEQVDAMTSFADAPVINSKSRKPSWKASRDTKPRLYVSQQESNIWIAHA